MPIMALAFFVCSIIVLTCGSLTLILAQDQKDIIIGILFTTIAISGLFTAATIYQNWAITDVCHDMGGEMAHGRCYINTDTNDNINA